MIIDHVSPATAAEVAASVLSNVMCKEMGTGLSETRANAKLW